MPDNSHSATPRPWSADEDALLKDAVAQHGDEPGVWKTIAQRIPGRTNKACRKRWLHSLSPNIRKTPWTPAEDALLLKLYATHNPPRWSLIAKHIPGRTDDACSKRYREALDPQLKKDDWTQDEDARLIDLTVRLGSKWTQVGQAMGRSGLGCRNRWRLLQRKQRARTTSRSSPPEEGTYGPSPPYLPVLTDYPTSSFHTSFPPEATSLPPPVTLPLTGDLAGQPLHHSADGSFSELTSGQSSSVIHRSLPCTISTLSSLSGALASSTLEAHRDPSPCPWIDPDLASTPPSQYPPAERHTESSEVTTAQPPNASTASSPRAQFPLTSPAASTILEDQSSDPSPILVSPTPPEHPGADPGTDKPVSVSDQALSVPLRKRPRLCGPLSTEQDPTQYPRLSSRLPADLDRTILPYACGHTLCWPGTTGNGASRFATASELAEHRRVAHPGGDNSSNVGDGGKAYRCALQGCGKGWKNINGIQYHLQISKAHFKAALSQTRAPSDDDDDAAAAVGSHTASHDADQPRADTAASPKDADNGSARKGRRKEFHCPHEGCTKTYKQRTGLQYHLAHGHPANVAQLEVIPPGLMQKIKADVQPSISEHRQKAAHP